MEGTGAHVPDQLPDQLSDQLSDQIATSDHPTGHDAGRPLLTRSDSASFSVSEPHLDAAADLLRLLGAPVRLALLVELARGSRCVHELVGALYDAGRPVSQPLVSQHLRVLRTAALVTAKRSGHEMVYALADDHVGHVVRDAISHARHLAVGVVGGAGSGDR